jgi:SRSO17 transposase
LNKLKKYVSLQVYKKLAVMLGISYTYEADFIKALALILNKEELALYQSYIVKRARRNVHSSHRRKRRKSESAPSIKLPPIMNLSERDIDSLLPELEAYHGIYSPLFARREQRDSSLAYLHGLLLDIPNKSVESMVLAMEGAHENKIRSLQHFAGKGAWDDDKILLRHRKEVAHTLGEEDGVIIVDGCDFLKQGKDSSGVYRQYCGEVGKRANCQAGVFLAYASRKGFTLLDRRLYLPEAWLSDEFASLRRKCGIPEDISFQTKNQLTVEMLTGIYQAGHLPYKWLTCDEAFGRDTKFLDAVASMVYYFAEIPCDTHVWLDRPETHIPPYSGRGPYPKYERLKSGEPDSERVDRLIAELSPDSWTTHIVKEGEKGPIVCEFASIRVVTRRDKLPGPDNWLIVRRNRHTGEVKYYLSNAPLDTSIETFVWLSGMRWPIETSFKQCKQEVGMGDYQLRSWRGWHHHMTLCILAHFFLVRISRKLANKAPNLTLEQTVLLLRAVLPRQSFDAKWAIAILKYRRRRNYAAYLSHRRKLFKELNLSSHTIIPIICEEHSVSLGKI